MKISSIGLEKLNSKDPQIKYGFTRERLKTGASAHGALLKLIIKKKINYFQ